MAGSEIPLQDLPLWMRRSRRGVDWGILISIAVSILAALPFLLQPGLPRTNASENYVFRVNDYTQALSEGHLYPRWSPNVFGGYGAPVPSFYPPAPAYIPALIQFFFTGDPVSAVQTVYAASIVLAGSVLYAFVMRRMGAASGVLASTLYVFSPYVSLVAPHILGDLPSVICMALLPSLLWSIDRLLISHHNTDLLLVALSVAGLLLTDPRCALVGLLIAAAYLLWFRAAVSASLRWRGVLIAVLFGVLLPAFYWLPALAEQSAVTWRSAGESVTHFLSLSGLLTPLRPIDPNELVHTPQFTLGLALVAFTVTTIIVWFWRRRSTSFHLLFLGVAGVLLVTGLAALPAEIWLLGPIVMCLSISGTALLHGSKPPHRLFFPLLFVVVLALSTPVWFVPRWSDAFGAADGLAQVQYEQLGYGVAVVPPGSAVPSTIAPNLEPDQTLVNSYASDTIRKIPITPGVQVGVLAHTAQSDQFQIEARASASLPVFTAYFPGWSAWLNEMPRRVQPDRAGLLSVDLPANSSGTLTIALDTTPVRTAAWVISLVALALLLIMAFRRFDDEDSLFELSLLPIPQTRLAGLVVAAAGALMLLFTTQASPFSLTARPGYALDGSTTLRARTEVGLEALSFRLNDQAFTFGEPIPLTLYWRALRFLPANYRAQVLLLDLSSGERFTLTGLHHPGGYPTQRWLSDRYVTARYSLPLPEAAESGEYALAVEVFDCAANCSPADRLTFFDQNGARLGQTLVLPQMVMLVSR